MLEYYVLVDSYFQQNREYALRVEDLFFSRHRYYLICVAKKVAIELETPVDFDDLDCDLKLQVVDFSLYFLLIEAVYRDDLFVGSMVRVTAMKLAMREMNPHQDERQQVEELMVGYYSIELTP